MQRSWPGAARCGSTTGCGKKAILLVTRIKDAANIVVRANFWIIAAFTAQI
jgi:hypothetical protein